MAAGKLKDHKAMILAAAAAIGATTRPSGETPQQQRTRIVTGIKAQLAALDKAWTLSWLMMSPGNANLAYIAQNGTTEQVVVGIRGTSDNIVDVLEDFDVATAVPMHIESLAHHSMRAGPTNRAMSTTMHGARCFAGG